MRIRKNVHYAVLTGDIVGSTSLTAAKRKRLKAEITRAMDSLRAADEKLIPLPGAVFRGDSWQLLVRKPAKALRIAILMRCHLRYRLGAKVDSRVSIGAGAVDFIPGEKIADGDGAAFQLSGRGLDAMKSKTRLAFATQDAEHPLADAVIRLLDVMVSSWTSAQSQAMIGVLTGKNQREIAKAWKPKRISEQAVGQHRNAVNWHAVDASLAAFELEYAGFQNK